MKTTVSIPDTLFQSAEKHLKRLRIPRSELYARALQQYLDRLDEAAATESYDRVYGRSNDSDRRQDGGFQEAGLRAWAQEENEW